MSDDPSERSSGAEKQCARAVMMIRPSRFQANPQTALTNRFQNLDVAPPPALAQDRAMEEFEGLVGALADAGVEVLVFDDTPEPHTPSSIFPNNWISTHADGTVVTYPMLTPNRRAERRMDIVETGLGAAGFVVRQVIDLSPHEAEDRALEGTGSLILDRPGRVAYACLSPRTHPSVAEEFATLLGYSLHCFAALGVSGEPIYHTNVILSIGEGFAVFCPEVAPDPAQAAATTARLEASGREVLRIDRAQMNAFAGNVLELEDAAGEKLLAMSTQAEASLRQAQRELLERHARIVSAPIDTIELCEGGSVRCMLAEIHLPRA